MTDDQVARDFLPFAVAVARKLWRDDEAESAAGEALAEAVRSRHKVREGFEGYVRVAVANRVRNAALVERRHGFRRSDPGDRPVRHPFDPSRDDRPSRDPVADRHEGYEHLTHDLPAPQKQLFHLVFVEGFTQGEAGEVMGLKPMAASRLYRKALGLARARAERDRLN